jgi:hypothetical protein
VNKKIIDIDTDEIKENSRSHMQNNIENHIREEEINNNVGTSKEYIENKNSGQGAEQDANRNKLKEQLQIMWYKARLLQVPERQRLPKLRESKLIHLKK